MTTRWPHKLTAGLKWMAVTAAALPHMAGAATPPAPAPLVVPAAMQPQVDFWRRIYTEVDSRHGLLHDSVHLEVVYGQAAVPQGVSWRAAQRLLKAQVRALAADLGALAQSPPEQWNARQAALAAAWPGHPDAATFAAAAEHVRFQTGQKDRFLAGLLRGRTWMPAIDSTMAAYGLPRELAALPHVESSFDPLALSKARAAGIWQFMPATARLYLRMDSTVDERFDPVRSTEAAARLLRHNFARLGSWPVAITAYNHGTEGMRRAVQAMGTSDIASLVANYHHRHFGFASRNFYAELMAAWQVSQAPEASFGHLTPKNVVVYDSVTLDAHYPAPAVARALGVSLAALRTHNPSLRPMVWQGQRLLPKGFDLRLPRTGAAARPMAEQLAQLPSSERWAQVPAAYAAAPPRRQRTKVRVQAVVPREALAARQLPAAAPLPSPAHAYDVSSPSFLPAAPAPTLERF